MNRLISLVFIICLSLATVAQASTIYLSAFGNDNNDGTKENPVKTVKRGYTLAGDGGVVIMKAGVYTNTGNEGIDIRYNITFQGENFENSSPYLTRISCSTGGADNVFAINDKSALLFIKGIAVTNCKQSVYVNEGSFAAYKSVIRGKPQAINWNYGGSVTRVTLTQTVLEGEQGTADAIGVMHACSAGKAHTLTLTQVTLKNIKFGVSLPGCTTNVDLTVNVHDSTLDASASAVYLSAARDVRLFVVNSAFVTTNTKGIYLNGGVLTSIVGSRFQGASIYSDNLKATPRALNISESIFTGINGRAVYVQFPVEPIGIRNCAFGAQNPPVDESAMPVGIEVDVYDTSPASFIDVKNVTFVGVDKGIYLHSSYTSSKPTLTVQQAQFRDVGSAVLTQFPNGAKVNVDMTNVSAVGSRNHTLLFKGNPTVQLKYVEISNSALNAVRYEGANFPAGNLMWSHAFATANQQGLVVFGPHVVEIRESTFKDNDAGGFTGAGLHFEGEGQLNLQEVTFTHNSANKGGAVYLDGPGALFVGCKFLNNVAKESGGGVLCTGTGTLTVGNSVFYQNAAPQGATGDCSEGMCAAEGFDNQETDNGPGVSKCNGF